MVSRKSKRSKTLHEHSAMGNYTQVKKMITSKKYRVDQVDEKFNTPLHVACDYNRLDIVAYLIIECGADYTLETGKYIVFNNLMTLILLAILLR